LARGFAEGDFVAGRVDLEQGLAGLDRFALLIKPLDQNAADPGTDFGFARAFGLRHDLDGRRNFLRLDVQHRYRQRPHGWRCGGFAVGAGTERQHAGDDNEVELAGP
jgi:hypothetical protein